MKNFLQFKAEVRKSLDLHEWGYKDLARETGYSIHYINSAMAGRYCSGKLAEKIVNVLELPKSLAS